MLTSCLLLFIIILHLENGLLLPSGNVIQECIHATFPRIMRPEGSAEKIKICGMGNFGVRAEGFELEMAVMKSLAALFRVFQDKIQAIFVWKEYVPPSKFRIRFV